MPLDFAERLVTLDAGIDLRGLEQIVPYPIARDIVLSHPDHIVALECPAARVANIHVCRSTSASSSASRSRASSRSTIRSERAGSTQSEAVEILRAEHERGHVHHAFFKDAMLGRFYAICNCCSCCCGAMQAFRERGADACVVRLRRPQRR